MLRSPAKVLSSLIDHVSRWKAQWTLFLGCFFLYMANGRTIGSGDTLPASLWAFNLLENRTFHFDVLRGSHFLERASSGFFVEASNGHLTSAYPIGVAIITFPLYVIYFLWLKAQGWLQSLTTGESINLVNLTDPDFTVYEASCEKLSAAILAAVTVVLFYQVARLKFSPKLALGLSLLFGVATETWMISSQGLWQHGASNLAVVTILYCLFRANRLKPGERKTWLWVAGLACGLLPGIRPSSVLYAIATIGYGLITYRKEALYLLLGLPSASLSAAWNYYYFGNFFGAYSRFSSGSNFVFTLDRFAEGFSGLLFSPSRGLLIYTPVSIYALWGAKTAFRFRLKKDEQLLAWLAIAALGIFVQYCFFGQWWAGWCYGPRFMTDLLPILCLLIGYAWAEPRRRHSRRRSQWAIAVFLTLTLYSTAVQAVGAFGTTPWDAIPDSRVNPHTDFRLWGWRDSQIERHARKLVNTWFPPIPDTAAYLSQTDGTLEQLMTEAREPIAPEGVLPMRVSRPKVLRAIVRNTGQTRWYGYETGLVEGIISIQVQFIDAAGNRVKPRKPSQLYVSGNVEPGQTAQAIGRVFAPSKPGFYRLEFNLQVNEVGDFLPNADPTDYTVTTQVKPKASAGGPPSPLTP